MCRRQWRHCWTWSWIECSRWWTIQWHNCTTEALSNWDYTLLTRLLMEEEEEATCQSVAANESLFPLWSSSSHHLLIIILILIILLSTSRQWDRKYLANPLSFPSLMPSAYTQWLLFWPYTFHLPSVEVALLPPCPLSSFPFLSFLYIQFNLGDPISCELNACLRQTEEQINDNTSRESLPKLNTVFWSDSIIIIIKPVKKYVQPSPFTPPFCAYKHTTMQRL